MEKIVCDCVFIIKSEEGNIDWPEHYNTCAIKINERKVNGEFPNGHPRNSDGSLKQQNPYLNELKQDFLYHLALDTKTHNLRALFGDVKFVCMGGTAHRMHTLAVKAAEEFGVEIPSGGLIDMTAASHRFCLYKVGPIISVNHGIGLSTFSVVLQEVIKLLQYSGAKDPIIIRVGTSGGIGVQPGTVVVSDKGYDGMLHDSYDLAILGKIVSMPAVLDQRLAKELTSMRRETDGFATEMGGTMCANDFYNGQGRTDGPFCNYTEDDKFEFLLRLKEKGIKNIEMEVTCLAALTYMAGIKAADVCVTLVDRLHGDQVTVPKNIMLEWQERPMVIIFRYIKKYLQNIG